MNKELLIKLATGLVAKVIRYGLVAAGGIGAGDSVTNPDGVDIEQLAIGIATIGVSMGWSVWEDRVKRAVPAPKEAEAEQAVPIKHVNPES